MHKVLLSEVVTVLRQSLNDEELWTLLSWWCDVPAPRLKLEKQTYYLPLEDTESLYAVAQKRASGIALTYALGWRPFYGRKFHVGPTVLVPRQETEELVDHLVQFAASRTLLPVLVDCGTGSGCIPVTAALEASWAAVHAWDISAGALEVASRNATNLLLEERIVLHHGDITQEAWGDWLSGLLSKLDTDQECIISGNLPYIPTDAMADLDADVQQEPTLALDGGLHGTAIMKPWLLQIGRAVRASSTWGRITATLEGDPDNVEDLNKWCAEHELPIQWREDALGQLRFCDITFPEPSRG